MSQPDPDTWRRQVRQWLATVLEPAREPVSFDAMLQPSTLQYSVTRGRG